MPLVVSPFYAALLAIFYFVPTFNIIRMRRTLKIGIGHGDNHQLKRMIRVHANFSEYIPLALILLCCLEFQEAPHWVLHLIGSMLFLGRILHSLGLSQKPGYSIGRFWGSFLTYKSMLISSIYLVANYIKYALNI